MAARILGDVVRKLLFVLAVTGLALTAITALGGRIADPVLGRLAAARVGPGRTSGRRRNHRGAGRLRHPIGR